MFTKEDLRQIAELGMDPAAVSAQVNRLKKGFPWLDIVAPAVPGRGVKVLGEAEASEAEAYCDSAKTEGRCKFVPASGAASRMFKDIFAGAAQLAEGHPLPQDAPLARLAGSIKDFAFYTPEDFPTSDPADVAGRLLGDKGLGYGSKPKGVLKFHRYPDEVRTALAEHLVEGQAYMRNPDGTVRLEITVSPEHLDLFKKALEDVRPAYEKRYGVRYDVRFSFQDKSTDTIAVDPDGKPFRKDDGSLLFRPAGHGALLRNLAGAGVELVSIKNIDNVAVERLLPETARWKRILMGRALQLRDRIRGYLFAMDQVEAVHPFSPIFYFPAYTPTPADPYANPEAQELCNEIEGFLRDEFCIEIPQAKDCRGRAEALRSKLDRPLRVCGMVRNQGEPGGGPFIVRSKDGSTSLQILESVQINKDDPGALAAMKASTHFNPVDLVCCLLDRDGNPYDLEEYTDPETGFISSKSFQGRELKALELPGLWNGAMSDWNTQFVEVPLATFNPVKTVLDLLRPQHQV